MSSTNKTFSIGQIVYILAKQSQSIIPAMIVEEQTIQTLQGKKVYWKIAFGEPGPKQKIVDSNRINGEIFTSLSEIKSLLLRNLQKFVENTIKTAEQTENQWYGRLKAENKVKNSQQPSYREEPMGLINPETFLEQNNDIVSSYVDEPMNNNTQYLEKTLSEDLAKERLRQSMMPTREELMSNDFEQIRDADMGDTEQVMIDGPDGRPMLANVKTGF
jgi:hypothetical protein